MEELTDLQLALQVVQRLHEAGIQCVIAGGSARDTLLGLVPKDYDIIILGDRDYSGDVLDVLDEHNMAFDTYGMAGDAYTGHNPQESHLMWVVKTSNEVDIDIIQQRRLPMTASEAVEGFDVSLNMAWIETDGPDGWIVCNHPDFPQPGEVVKVLRDCDVPAQRIPYLAAKYPGYLWPTITQGL